MPKSFLEIVIGDLGEKQAHRQFMKRVKTLPKDYRFAFKKIQRYMWNFGTIDSNTTVFTDLAELFEASAAEGKPVLDVIGTDVAAFCDEFIHAAATDAITSGEKLNKEIMEHFKREEK